MSASCLLEPDRTTVCALLTGQRMQGVSSQTLYDQGHHKRVWVLTRTIARGTISLDCMSPHSSGTWPACPAHRWLHDGGQVSRETGQHNQHTTSKTPRLTWLRSPSN